MFAVVMITVDRSPKQNFVGDTLAALERAGVFDSPLLESFTVFDSGSPSLDFLPNGWLIDSAKRCPVGNTAAALAHGANSGSPWVLFLEDDIDVCDKFLESIAGWLYDHHEGYEVFPLGANYDMILALERLDKTAWRYSVNQFYGTLAVAMRARTAGSIADYLLKHHSSPERRVGSPYDLYMADWARENHITHFLTPVPSFVQHTGVESIIRPGSIFHTYESWPGPEWSYQRRA
jgi:hypothetical protein